MSDILTPPADTTPQLVELIYERGQVPQLFLRPIEEGAPYFDLSRVERLVEPIVPALGESTAAEREWEPLGPVYLLGGTLQTLRWSNSPEPATYHVGRVPEAASYRLMGEDHEYTLQELLDTLSQGPADFRGYPVGQEHRLQFTPARTGEVSSESEEWEAVTKRLRSGESLVRSGTHYQLYEEVTEDGSATGTYFIGQLASEGEWFTEHTKTEVEEASSWVALLRPTAKVAA